MEVTTAQGDFATTLQTIFGDDDASDMSLSDDDLSTIPASSPPPVSIELTTSPSTKRNSTQALNGRIAFRQSCQSPSPPSHSSDLSIFEDDLDGSELSNASDVPDWNSSDEECRKSWARNKDVYSTSHNSDKGGSSHAPLLGKSKHADGTRKTPERKRRKIVRKSAILTGSDEENAEAQCVKTKKRHPSSQASKDVRNESACKQPALSTLPKKRGPGRPRKHPLPTESEPYSRPNSHKKKAAEKSAVASSLKHRKSAEDPDTKRAGAVSGANQRLGFDLANPNRRDRSGRSQLFKYTARGDAVSCRNLIRAGADVNLRDYAGWTPLHEACLHGELEIAELLLRHGADANACGLDDDTPLHDAAQNGHAKVVHLLIQHGANVRCKNAKQLTAMDVCSDQRVLRLLRSHYKSKDGVEARDKTGQTLLHRVCEYPEDDGSAILSLLKQGADVNARDNAGWSPLHEAALRGHVSMVKVLLTQGAEVNIRGYADDTPLHDACQNGHAKVVRILLEHGADPLSKNSAGETPCDVAGSDEVLEVLEEKLGRKIPRRKPSSQKVRRRHLSQRDSIASVGEEKKVKMEEEGEYNDDKHAKSNRASPEASDTPNDMETSDALAEPWWLPSRTGSLSREERKIQQYMRTFKKMETREELRSKGVRRGRPPRRLSDTDLEGREESDDKYEGGVSNERTLKCCSEERDTTRISTRDSPTTGRVSVDVEDNTTAERATSPKPKSDDINTPVKSRHSGKTDRNRRRTESPVDSHGSTPTHERPRPAPRNRRRNTSTPPAQGFETPCVKLFDTRPKDAKGESPLHRFARLGEMDKLGQLLQQVSCVNVCDRNGCTPLHEAASVGHSEVVGLLLAFGADVNARNLLQETPLHTAAKNGHYDVAKLLLDNNARLELRNRDGLAAVDLAADHPQVLELIQEAMEEEGYSETTPMVVSSRSTKNDEAGESMPLPRRRGRPPKNPSRMSKANDANETKTRSSPENIVDANTKLSSDTPAPRRSRNVSNSSLDGDEKHTKLRQSRDSREKTRRKPNASADVRKSGDEMAVSVKIEEPEVGVDSGGMLENYDNLNGCIKLEMPETGTDDDNDAANNKMSPALARAMRYLPLYTIAFQGDGSTDTISSLTTCSSAYVVDLQVALLLDIHGSLFATYPRLRRRAISERQKQRLYEPLASMVEHLLLDSATLKKYGKSDGGDEAHAQELNSLAEMDKFLNMKLYFVRLDDVISIIQRDYQYLVQKLITITLDIGYSPPEQHTDSVVKTEFTSPTERVAQECQYHSSEVSASMEGASESIGSCTCRDSLLASPPPTSTSDKDDTTRAARGVKLPPKMAMKMQNRHFLV
ncbi:uncharacterized protein VTP21DRAFT_8170 [Calcarisporiella thermophila]|uniref:uncharacterized protein n=1 Tax=Calcarisporiella thermophila TaxID=911321 RepID=UPI0037437F0E